MNNAKKNVALLAGCQAMLFINNVTLFSLAALAGHYLADNKALATLPATAYVVGAALIMLPASFFMKRFGRQAGFLFGTSMGIVGAALACVALWLHSFWLLCFAILVLGAYNVVLCGGPRNGLNLAQRWRPVRSSYLLGGSS